ELRPVLSPRTDKRGCCLPGAHLWLVVVGGHVARGGDQLAPLAAVGGLLTPVEEVRGVRVLLGRGNAQLLGSAQRDHVGERDRRALGGEGDRVGPALLVLGE